MAKKKWTPPPPNDERLEGLAKIVFDHGLEYTNRWLASYNGPPIDPDDFYRYQQTFLLADIRLPSSRLISIQTGYGDDGGPVVLTASFRFGYYPDATNWSLHWIVQEFDATPTLIYGADSRGVLDFLNLPEEAE